MAVGEGASDDTVQIVKSLMEKTQTSAELQVTVDIMDNAYEIGRACAKGFKETTKIAFDDFLPKWDYRAIPIVT